MSTVAGKVLGGIIEKKRLMVNLDDVIILGKTFALGNIITYI